MDNLAVKTKMVLKIDALSAFLGLGYVIGLRYNAVIVAGGLLSHFAFIPAIWFLGQHVPGAVYPGTVPISGMSETQIFSTYVRNIGIGAIFMAGVLGIIKSMPVMVKSFSLGFREIFKGKKAGAAADAEDRPRPQDEDDHPRPAGHGRGPVPLFPLDLERQAGHHRRPHLPPPVVPVHDGRGLRHRHRRDEPRLGHDPDHDHPVERRPARRGPVRGRRAWPSPCSSARSSARPCRSPGSFVTDLKIGYWLGATPRNQERFKFAGVLVSRPDRRASPSTSSTRPSPSRAGPWPRPRPT